MNKYATINKAPAKDNSAACLLTILSRIYLEAGLPLEWAVRSALADYECCLQPGTQP